MEPGTAEDKIMVFHNGMDTELIYLCNQVIALKQMVATEHIKSLPCVGFPFLLERGFM